MTWGVTGTTHIDWCFGNNDRIYAAMMKFVGGGSPVERNDDRPMKYEPT
jgi:hypothetical protein